MVSIKSKIAYAVVNKKRPVIDTLDVFNHDDVTVGESEILIKVLITAVDGKPFKTKKR